MVDDAGGVIDDLLVYRNPFGYTVVCNASNREAVVEQFLARRPASVPASVLADRTADTAMIALQGPMALEVLQPLTVCALAGLRYYHATMGQVAGAESVISRTGYTGEDGFELIVSAARAVEVWDRLMAQGAAASILPCGLGARDTLRFEAAMPLYGHEMDRTVNPYEAGLAWAVKPAKGEFVGRQALRDAQAACGRARIGLALPGKRIARQGAAVLDGDRQVGVVTSGTYAITLQRSLAMALVESQAATPGTSLAVDIRGTREPAEVVPLPFYRRDRYLSSGLGRTT
jgi:aminomethyltransferase